MSQREKQTVGFPLFPCTTSDSSTDNIFPNNCATNPNALNYSRQEMVLENVQPGEAPDHPNLLRNTFQNDSFDKKSTLERYHRPNNIGPEHRFDRFERPKWGSDRFDIDRLEQASINSGHFERGQNSLRNERGSGRKTYYTKPKYSIEYNNEDYQHDYAGNEPNVYSEPVDNSHYEDTGRMEFDRGDSDRR